MTDLLRRIDSHAVGPAGFAALPCPPGRLRYGGCDADDLDSAIDHALGAAGLGPIGGADAGPLADTAALYTDDAGYDGCRTLVAVVYRPSDYAHCPGIVADIFDLSY